VNAVLALNMAAIILSVPLSLTRADERAVDPAEAWRAAREAGWVRCGSTVVAATLVVAALIGAGLCRIAVYVAYGSGVVLLAVACRLAVLLGADLPAPALPRPGA